MSVAGGYPEKVPENLPEMRQVPSPIFDVAAVARSFNYDFTSNAIEATIVAPDAGPAQKELQRQYDSVQETAHRQAAVCIRQLQALEALGGVFFEGLNRAYAQVEEFTNRDPLEQMLDSPAEAAWRAKLATSTKGSLPIPLVSKGLQVLVAPRIRTEVPSDPDSKQVGYLNSQGAYAPLGTGIIGNNPASYQRFMVPLASAVREEHPVSLEARDFTSTQDPEYYRHAAALLLADGYKSLACQELHTVTLVEATAVVPGIAQTGRIDATGISIDIGQVDYSTAGKAPQKYWVELLHDGRRAKGQLMEPYSARPLLSPDEKDPFIPLPPLEEALPRPPVRAFTREKEDMTISIIGMPVQTFTQSSKTEINPTLPVNEYKALGSSKYMQIDNNHSCFIAHIAIVGSY
jgi:hypothetical protein